MVTISKKRPGWCGYLWLVNSKMTLLFHKVGKNKSLSLHQTFFSHIAIDLYLNGQDFFFLGKSFLSPICGFFEHFWPFLTLLLLSMKTLCWNINFVIVEKYLKMPFRLLCIGWKMSKDWNFHHIVQRWIPIKVVR